MSFFDKFAPVERFFDRTAVGFLLAIGMIEAAAVALVHI
jgi:hypothetical protein